MFGAVAGAAGGGGGGGTKYGGDMKKSMQTDQKSAIDFGSSQFGGDINTGGSSGGARGLSVSPWLIAAAVGLAGLYLWKRKR